ncbi:type VII secretion protein EccB [Nakamurella deserti]|uniref:type VII secretion protein EccB n=1 Tax=Nakamurella deserti TaxID=2164074 RepID=UPI000DBE4B4D|nr:type VII secretion protein EccB [Nakamurella deserti]
MIGPAQLRAHRYARRRMDLALTVGTTSPTVDPGRLARRSTVASFGLALALLAGAGVIAAVRPAPDWSAAEVLVDTGSGAVYLNRDGVLHPALNLVSALLAADTPVAPEPLQVSGADIEGVPRGPLIGIAGAPAELPTRDRLITTGWTLCVQSAADGSSSTTAVFGAPAPGISMPASTAALVRTDDRAGGSADHLIWAGRSIPVDPTDRALTDALGVTGASPRPVDGALTSVLPAVAAPTAPVPSGAGGRADVEITDAAGDPVPVGAVLRTEQADGRMTLHLLHRDGVESLTPVVADLAAARIGSGVVPVQGWQVAALPDTQEPPTVTTALPPTAPRLVPADDSLCATWQGTTAGWGLSAGGALEGTSVSAPGSRVDRILMPPGAGAVVRVVDAAGDADPVDRLITGAGVVYPLGAEVATRLGLTDDGATPPAVPAALVGLLSAGPPLTVESAGVAWDPGEITGVPTAAPTTGPSPQPAEGP